MIRSRTLAAVVAAATVVAPHAARAQDSEAVRHFRTGVRLYKDGNFAGALAEFEEAYRQNPTPSALSNIALCQKALFRYAEASATLDKMLRVHGAAVSPEDRKAAEETMAELRGFVAEVTLAVDPPDAAVSVDGREVPGGAERRLTLNVGEHRIVAESPRFRRFDSVVSLAGGARRLDVRLVADLGELSIVADDPEAAIAVDGVPLGFGTWTGKVSAGERHTVHVYKPGHVPTVLEITVVKGERREVKAVLGARTKDTTVATPFPYTRPPGRHGPYGFLTASYYTLTGDPDGFATAQKKNDLRDGSYFGARVGWLLVPQFGVEGVIEGGRNNVGPGCYPADADGSCADPPPGDRRVSYDLTGVRFAAAGRYITRGETLRFVAVSGVGVTRQTLHIGSSSASQAAGLPSGTGSAYNGWFFLEGGGELSFGRVLIDGVVGFSVMGVNNITIGGKRVYEGARNATMGGFGIRVGYGIW